MNYSSAKFSRYTVLNSETFSLFGLEVSCPNCESWGGCNSGNILYTLDYKRITERTILVPFLRQSYYRGSRNAGFYCTYILLLKQVCW